MNSFTSLLVLMALASVADADGFPSAPGPCDDLAACENACKASKPGTCFWGGVLALSDAVDPERKTRARPLFERACTKGDVDACWHAAKLGDPGEGAPEKDRKKARAAYERVCNKRHARACFAAAQIIALPGDDKAKQLAAPVYAKGLKVLDQRCQKQKDAGSCSWLADKYGSGGIVPAYAAKAAAYRERACQIQTGQACPPPPPPRPPRTKPARKGAAPGE